VDAAEAAAMAQSDAAGIKAAARPALEDRIRAVSRGAGQALFWMALAAAILFFLFPIFWMLETSFKTVNEANSPTPALIGFRPTLANYHNVFFLTTENVAGSGGTTTITTGFLRYFVNSIIIGSISTLVALVLGMLAAYGFSRFRVAAKSDLLFFILSQRMLPPVAVLIPIFLMYRAVHLVDTYAGMILLYTTFILPFAVWMIKGFVDEIPHEYEDAAMVDGYTRFQAFYKVIVPQSFSALAATAVFSLITVWNEFIFALVLTEPGGVRTAPPSIAAAAGGGQGNIDWGLVAAASMVFVLPVVIFTFMVRNHLLRGVTFGAVRR
jgi:multiple sugar transport system permease protein